jgi:hypothetical protein
MQRMKYWCEPCDYVCKSQGPATCPHCMQPMRNMGDKWRVGKKGHRVDWKIVPAPDRFYWAPLHERMKLLGNLIFDKKRGTWKYTADYKKRESR